MAWPYGTVKKKTFRSAKHGNVVLTRDVWRHIVRNNRCLVELNPHLIGPTLQDPDEVRQSQHKEDSDSFFYYRKPKAIKFGPKVTVPPGKLSFAVCIDAQKGRIKTIYVPTTRVNGNVVYKRKR